MTLKVTCGDCTIEITDDSGKLGLEHVMELMNIAQMSSPDRPPSMVKEFHDVFLKGSIFKKSMDDRCAAIRFSLAPAEPVAAA